MTEEEYYAEEFSNEFLDALADAGDFFNREEGIYGTVDTDKLK